MRTFTGDKGHQDVHDRTLTRDVAIEVLLKESHNAVGVGQLLLRYPGAINRPSCESFTVIIKIGLPAEAHQLLLGLMDRTSLRRRRGSKGRGTELPRTR